MNAGLRTVVVARTALTRSICRLELADPAGLPLPGYSAGAHIAVSTPRGHVRTYSLNEPGAHAPRRYAIAVARGRDGGGSACLVDAVAVGDLLTISPPRNTFPVATGNRHLLIAGGIGITPIRALFTRLRADRGTHARLLYLTRHPEDTAYLAELGGAGHAGAVTIHHSATGGRLDLWPYLARPADTHLYCCGPASLMAQVHALTAHWDPRRVHFEHFTAASAGKPGDTAFTVHWAPTGQTVPVEAGQTILDALRRNGIIVESSCNAGTCGACVLRVLAGAPDHRDVVLTDADRRDTMTACVSRALSPELELTPLS